MRCDNDLRASRTQVALADGQRQVQRDAPVFQLCGVLLRRQTTRRPLDPARLAVFAEVEDSKADLVIEDPVGVEDLNQQRVREAFGVLDLQARLANVE